MGWLLPGICSGMGRLCDTSRPQKSTVHVSWAMPCPVLTIASTDLQPSASPVLNLELTLYLTVGTWYILPETGTVAHPEMPSLSATPWCTDNDDGIVTEKQVLTQPTFALILVNPPAVPSRDIELLERRLESKYSGQVVCFIERGGFPV